MATKKEQELQKQRRRQFEEFEQRLVMSAQAVTAIAPQIKSVEIQPQVETSAVNLSEAHSETGVDHVHQQYGFDGSGQTVAIIDSGIAWDHYALGNGFGEDYRVVGGWDFAENDANPYDDGPAGYHGTHVAGIVGSADADNLGVASGVDLVGLRVFDDAGAGNLEWVEQALQWVHENKDQFENPITTVNLSLGTDWNAFNVPEWATLENEFAQLEADGIFISVAAGNSFASFGQTGLSYPAVSPFVVPVSSHGADGSALSDFSQRASNVLVAPGESIRSTVPDHLFGGMQTDGYLGASGTSMAAPYVAGASALLRQANEFMGETNIDQDLLYQQFMESADQIYDSVTHSFYSKLNLEDAIASVIKDLQGDTWGTATDAGVLVNGTSITGTIGQVNDVDTFSFRAQTTGRVTLNFDTTHDLSPLLRVQNSDYTVEGNSVSFSVQAGTVYKFSVGTNDGIGHYKINVGVQAGVDATNWGSVTSNAFNHRQINGTEWFKVTAGNGGIMTLQASLQSASQSLNVEIYDAQMNAIGTGSTVNGQLRLDVDANIGDSYFIKASSNGALASFNMTNLVSLQNGRLVVNGTQGNDDFTVTDRNILLIDVNGLSYSFDADDVDQVTVLGKGGEDSLSTVLDSGDNQVTLTPRNMIANSGDQQFIAAGIENIKINGAGGNDVIVMKDSAGADKVQNYDSTIVMSGAGYRNQVGGFETAIVNSTEGFDQLKFSGTAGDDAFWSKDGVHKLVTESITITATHFDQVHAVGGGGNDVATIADSIGDDEFVLRPIYAHLSNSKYTVQVNDFSQINAITTSGNDVLTTIDSILDDQFVRRDEMSLMKGSFYTNYATGFSEVTVVSREGYDVAQIYDTHGNDSFYSSSLAAYLVNSSGTTAALNFERVNVVSENGGFDRAYMSGTNGDDFVYADVGSATLTNAHGTINRVVGFNEVSIDTAGGNDAAYYLGGSGTDVLTANYDRTEVESTLQTLRLVNAENVRFNGNGGTDEVIFSDFEALDLLAAIGDKATATLDGHKVTAEDFDLLSATSADGSTANYDIGAVDFLFMMRGDWQQQ